ncbi:MAG: lmo0937 family membrane protein [Syntrophomonadaceae bacterium]
MIWAIIGILFVLWLLGLILKVTAGGLIHLLLVVAVIIALVRLFSGRRVL